MRIMLCLFPIVMISACVSNYDEEKAARSAELESMLPQIRAWHTECHDQNIVMSCLRGAGVGMKYGFDEEALKDLMKGCELGDQMACFQSDRMKAKILRRDAIADDDQRRMRWDMYRSQQQYIEQITDAPSKAGTINGRPTGSPQPSKTVCAHKYNHVLGQMETICQED